MPLPNFDRPPLPLIAPVCVKVTPESTTMPLADPLRMMLLAEVKLEVLSSVPAAPMVTEPVDAPRFASMETVNVPALITVPPA